MGVCGGNSIKKDVEEEKKKKEEEDKSKSKDMSKEQDKDKDINKNNLQPSKDNSISKQLPNQQNKSKNENQKIFPQNNAPLPSAIHSVKMNMDGTSSVFPLSTVQNQNKSNKNKASAKSENANIENEEENQKPILLKNEHLIAPMEGQIFMKTMTDNQMKNLENYNINFYPKGEHIVLSFGDCFDIFNDFFTTLVLEHQLNKEQPIYNYDIFFDSVDNDNYSARGIAFNIPNDYYDIYLRSEINSVFNNNNIIFNTNKKSKTTLDMNAMNNAPVKQILNMNEKSDDFFKEFNNDTNNQKISNLLSTEAEKCNHLRCLHFLGNIFDGNSMGILCNFVNDIQEDYRKVLKLTHLKYFDSFEHKAFSKIKNYLYSISNLYDKCDLVNFFNCNKGGDILSCITVGERINEYSSGYSINQMLSDLLINPKFLEGKPGCEKVDVTDNKIIFTKKEGKEYSIAVEATVTDGNKKEVFIYQRLLKNIEAEPDKPNNDLIFYIILGSFAFVIIFVFILIFYIINKRKKNNPDIDDEDYNKIPVLRETINEDES